MPENPRLSSLGMNGILSERSGGLFRHFPNMVDGHIRHATGLKPLALAQGVGSLLSETMPEPGILILLGLELDRDILENWVRSKR